MKFTLVLLAVTVPMGAQTYVFDPPGSIQTEAFSINASGAITGFYFVGSTYHGYVRDPQGNFISFDPSGSIETTAYSINTSGAITGTYFDANSVIHGYVRDAQGNVTSFDPPGSVQTQAVSINASGAITGSFEDATSVYHGFVRDAQGNITLFDPPGSMGTGATSINASGAIAGSYYDVMFVYHGYARDPQGNITSFDAPGSLFTAAWSIDTSGEVTGQYEDATGVYHGYVRDPVGNIISFDPPGSGGTQSLTMNDGGTIAGFYTDGSGAYHGFVRDPQGNFTSFDPPGSIVDPILSINTSGAIVGWDEDAQFNIHGVVRTVPNGMDVSRFSGTISDASWQRAIAAGVSYVVVNAWSGKVPPTGQSNTQAQLTGAQAHGLSTAASIRLNYFDTESATYQVSQAITAIGSGLAGLKFIALDVEPCCGEFVAWQPSTAYAANSLIMDTSRHIQVVTNAGKSGPAAPAWNDEGGTTIDGTVTWTDTENVVLKQTNRTAEISAAAAYIKGTYGLPVVIHTDGPNESWQLITGNCGSTGTNPCPDLIALPLWDVEHKVFYAGDGTPHCGDGVAGLVPWTPYDSTTWQSRSGDQYDWGLYVPGLPAFDPSQDKDEASAQSAGICNGSSSRILFGLTSVDLDYFDPALFGTAAATTRK